MGAPPTWPPLWRHVHAAARVWPLRRLVCHRRLHGRVSAAATEFLARHCGSRSATSAEKFDAEKAREAGAGRPSKAGSGQDAYGDGNAVERHSSRASSRGHLIGQADGQSAFVTSDFADYRGMQLVFLGTSSSIPTVDRSTSCIALRLEGTIFLFDCGEGAVRQILKTPMKHYDIGHIFITHMHGDHVSSLLHVFINPANKRALIPLWPVTLIVESKGCCLLTIGEGLLCRIGLKEFETKVPIHVYSPQGLRQWIRSTLKASHARVHPKYAVHEMTLQKKSQPVARGWNLAEENHEDELAGKNIGCSSDGLWHMYKDDKYTVRASFLRHSIPCWGFVVEEHFRRGRFNVDRALQAGVRPGRYFRMLETGCSVTLPDGKVVTPADVLGPSRRGRKVVILGDTCDSKTMVSSAKEADVVVHEATVLEQDASEAYRRGHSTAKMAREFARTTNSGTLILTHFSRKLDGALFVDEKSTVRTTMKGLVVSAQKSFGKDSVIAADDFLAVTIQLTDKPAVQLAID